MAYIAICSFLIILIALLFWMERKAFLGLFKCSPKTLLALMLVIGVFFLLCSWKGLSFRTFEPSDQEWELLFQGKTLLSDPYTFSNLRYGLIYPIATFCLFKIFGPSPIAASVFNLALVSLSIAAVFALSQAMFKNGRVSLASTIIYAATPLIFAFASLQMGFPAILLFFLPLAVLAFLLFIETKKPNLLLLSLLLIALLGQTKPEYFILIVPLLFFFIVYKEYRSISAQTLLEFGAIFIFFSIPYLAKNSQFKLNYFSGFCGDIAQPYQKPVFNFFINNRYSPHYLAANLPDFLKFWTFRSLMVISPLACLGALMEKQWKKTLVVLGFFFAISFAYVANCSFYETRYAIPSYSLAVIFAGLGIDFISRKAYHLVVRVFPKERFRFFLKAALFLTILSLAAAWNLADYRLFLNSRSYPDALFTKRIIWDDYNRIKEDLRYIPDPHSRIITVQPNEEYILKFLGYSADSLINMANWNEVFKTGDFSATAISSGPAAGNYYIESDYCRVMPSTQNMCLIMKNLNLELVAQAEKDKIFIIK